MTDDNVMNKYIPADFDPDKLLPVRALRPKRKAGPREMNIRMMLPFTMRCGGCGSYLHIATKFNSRCSKIPLGDPSLGSLGLDAYRFRGQCKDCGCEFVFRTDPENSDYILESGGTRSYEAMKDAHLAEAEISRKRAEEEGREEGELEHKIFDTAAEMRRIEDLEILRGKGRREARREEVIYQALDRLFRDVENDKKIKDEQQDIDEWRTLTGNNDTVLSVISDDEDGNINQAKVEIVTISEQPAQFKNLRSRWSSALANPFAEYEDD